MRIGTCDRRTKETSIPARLYLDGGAVEDCNRYRLFRSYAGGSGRTRGVRVTLNAEGDLHVDGHHTVEDTGIVLGKALAEALGDKGGIRRYGSFLVPMDESLALASVDVSGRPFLVFDARFPEERIGDYDSCLTRRIFSGVGSKCRHHSASENALWPEFPPYGRGALQGGGPRSERSGDACGGDPLHQGISRLISASTCRKRMEFHDHFTGYRYPKPPMCPPRERGL